jgi:TolB-like protein/class 3 adenylate cyclase/tetratricopeptide (TPR) repeat protein
VTPRGCAIGGTRKIAAILVADIVGYSRLAGTDEDRTLSRLRGLRSDLIDPAIDAHHGRVVKRTGDGSLIEFRSVVDAVRCNAGLPPERRIEFRIGIHLGDVVEEADGDLMGDGVNIAARLEGIAKPGAICLSEEAYRPVKGRLDLTATDLGPTELKNIAEPIRVYSLDVGQPAEAKPAPAPTPEKPAPPRLSMVVLPFANIGGEPEQEHFVDGVTESLTTDLSRIRGSFVIGRNTAFTYKGKAVDLKQIGRELNVRHVLEGSVQRGGNGMRVNVQLIDAETGSHLWAERFDKPRADLFDMQDEIVSRLAGALNAQLVAAEARRAEQLPNPDSMDLYFQGHGLLQQGTETRHPRAGARLLRTRSRARSGQPRCGIGHGAGRCSIGQFLSDRRPAGTLRGRRSDSDQSIVVGAEQFLGALLVGLRSISSNRAVQGIAECERALVLDPNLARAHARIGLGKIFSGRPDETEPHVKEALRLSPRDDFAFEWMMTAGAAKLHLRANEEALTWPGRSIESDRNWPLTHFFLAAVFANLGRLEEARAATQAGLALDPTFTIRRFHLGAATDNASFMSTREHFYAGMRQAGVPEQ